MFVCMYTIRIEFKSKKYDNAIFAVSPGKFGSFCLETFPSFDLKACSKAVASTAQGGLMEIAMHHTPAVSKMQL